MFSKKTKKVVADANDHNVLETTLDIIEAAINDTLEHTNGVLESSREDTALDADEEDNGDETALETTQATVPASTDNDVEEELVVVKKEKQEGGSIQRIARSHVLLFPCCFLSTQN